MYVSGDLAMPGTIPTRKFRIGATVVANQVVQYEGISTPYGEITGPASVNSYALAVGVTQEAGTYASSSPHVFVRCSYSPFQLVRTKAAGGVASDTAHTTAALLTQDTASTTVLSDTAVADLDYTGGYLIGLTGANAGHVRVIDAQSDAASTTVTVPFASSIAVGDTVIRTYAPMIVGVELTTDYTQVNNLLATTEALVTSAIGEFIVWDVLIDDMSCAQSNYVGAIKNPTNPILEFVCMFHSHAFNRIS